MNAFKHFFLFLLLVSLAVTSASAQQTVHVFVALCDNANQGIVPVPAKLGNGQDPANNLYWGAAFGVKSYLRYKTTDWKLVATLPSNRKDILERVLFKHTTKDLYLLADAYDGAAIKTCTEDFLRAANGQAPLSIEHEGKTLLFGGQANLAAYVGHDGLMEFDVAIDYQPPQPNAKDVIMLACYSKSYFAPEIKKAGAHPLLWTTHLMAPEAYTLKAALDGWMAGETGAQVDERAAQAYHRYQKCGMNGARNLFTTGY